MAWKTLFENIIKTFAEPVTLPAFVIVIASMTFFIAGHAERGDMKKFNKFNFFVFVLLVSFLIFGWTIHVRLAKVTYQFMNHSHKSHSVLAHKHDAKTGLPVNAVATKLNVDK